jgi:hypothetical protein
MSNLLISETNWKKVIMLERLLVYLARELSMDDTSCS